MPSPAIGSAAPFLFVFLSFFGCIHFFRAASARLSHPVAFPFQLFLWPHSHVPSSLGSADGTGGVRPGILVLIVSALSRLGFHWGLTVVCPQDALIHSLICRPFSQLRIDFSRLDSFLVYLSFCSTPRSTDGTQVCRHEAIVGYRAGERFCHSWLAQLHRSAGSWGEILRPAGCERVVLLVVSGREGGELKRRRRRSDFVTDCGNGESLAGTSAGRMNAGGRFHVFATRLGWMECIWRECLRSG